MCEALGVTRYETFDFNEFHLFDNEMNDLSSIEKLSWIKEAFDSYCLRRDFVIYYICESLMMDAVFFSFLFEKNISINYKDMTMCRIYFQILLVTFEYSEIEE